MVIFFLGLMSSVKKSLVVPFKIPTRRISGSQIVGKGIDRTKAIWSSSLALDVVSQKRLIALKFSNQRISASNCGEENKNADTDACSLP